MRTSQNNEVADHELEYHSHTQISSTAHLAPILCVPWAVSRGKTVEARSWSLASTRPGQDCTPPYVFKA
jgi:hypothetical protein